MDGATLTTKRRICTDIGKWIDINSEAIYSSRPFDVCGEGENIIYTRNKGKVYVTLIDASMTEVNLHALGLTSPSIGKVTEVRTLEGNQKLRFRQTAEGLNVALQPIPATEGINDPKLSDGYKVLEISYTKSWFNDDDPGIETYGWDRKSNTGNGDYNNDLSFSNVRGDTWSTEFLGRSLAIVAPTGEFNGTMQVNIDGNTVGEVRFVRSDTRKPQQTVFKSKRMSKGKHTIKLTNQDGTTAIDALIIE